MPNLMAENARLGEMVRKMDEDQFLSVHNGKWQGTFWDFTRWAVVKGNTPEDVLAQLQERYVEEEDEE